MPIYEYACKKCGQFEVMRRISDGPLSRCPTCKGKVTKLISTTSFQLKGTGWYATDYARKGSSGKDKDADSKSDSSSESAKSDSDKTTKSSEAKSDQSKSTDTKSSGTSSAAA